MYAIPVCSGVEDHVYHVYPVGYRYQESSTDKDPGLILVASSTAQPARRRGT